MGIGTRRLLTLLFLFVAASIWTTLHAQSAGEQRIHYGSRLLHDPIDLARAIRPADVALAGGVVGVLIPLSLFDEPVRRSSLRRFDGRVGSYLGTANALGGKWGISLSAAVFGVSLLGDDLRFQNTAFTSLQAAGYAGAAALALKWVLGRRRPAKEVGAFDFAPASSFGSAFPSGHTAVAAAMVLPWAIEYRSAPSVLLVAAAVGTGCARVALDRHWLTDVLGGAALGSAIAIGLTRRYKHRYAR